MESQAQFAFIAAKVIAQEVRILGQVDEAKM